MYCDTCGFTPRHHCEECGYCPDGDKGDPRDMDPCLSCGNPICDECKGDHWHGF